MISKLTRIDTVLVRVHNLEATRVWYSNVLGLQPVYEDADERLVVFGVGSGASLTLHELKAGEETVAGCGARCYPIFYAEDIEATHRHFMEHGVVVGPITGEVGGTRWFVFEDIEGNPMEVCHYESP